MSGQVGLKYTPQCIDVEKILKAFIEKLEYYTLLTAQSINYTKTEEIWSAQAIGEHDIKWTNEFKYLV